MSKNSFGEKTEQPTPHRLREARKKGHVVKSADLSSAVSLLAAVLLFLVLGDTLVAWLREMLEQFLAGGITVDLTAIGVQRLVLLAGASFFKVMGLVFVTILFAGLTANFAQTGFVFSTESLNPSLERLNPVEGFKRIFSRRAMIELVKSFLKILLVGLAAFTFFRARFEDFLSYMLMPPVSFFKAFAADITSLGLRVGIIFLVLAVLDYMYQRYEYINSLKMTRQEVLEEYKQLEGDPLVRGKIKEKMRSLAGQRMMSAVPEATVVVTNPTSLAVALRYIPEKDAAPVVVAKGAGFIAEKIKEIARENKVPIIENKPVARMLYDSVKIGQVIPVELYQAVAEILAMVYRLNRQRGGV